MQRFKSILIPMQGKSKSNLHRLYNTQDIDEEEKVYHYEDLSFYFSGTSFRSSEKLLLYVETSFPREPADGEAVLYENFLLGELAPVIGQLGREYENNHKNMREKAQFAMQETGVRVLRRSGIRYDAEKRVFVLRINFNVPLVNAVSVNAKAAVRAVRDILAHIQKTIRTPDMQKLDRYLVTFRRQQEIRVYLKKNHFCVFIADGSILPRENGTAAPMKSAIPFQSPENMRVTVSFADGGELSGMAVREGVTVITGGGYSGKSTLLDAIETGIYNHFPGDGREFVITDDSALKIYAEDGRPVSELDISPFFRFLPGENETACFSTPHASGSVSQAANIIEAVCGGAGLLLIDEDKSATNFMIRDQNMRKIVKNEPIIPFTDRVRELYREKGVSTILVIGGSSEYLSCADTVLLMDQYVAKNITEEIGELQLAPTDSGAPEPAAYWQESRRVLPRKTNQAFLFFRSVETENEKRIILDEYSADITLLTAVASGNQLCTLMYAMEQLLTDKHANSEELLRKVTDIVHGVFDTPTKTNSLLPNAAQRFYEEIRPLDAFCCAGRMRGLHFTHTCARGKSI